MLSQSVPAGRMRDMLQERVLYMGEFMAREAALDSVRPAGWIAMADVFALPPVPPEATFGL